MKTMRAIANRLGALFRRNIMERDLEEEVRFHLEMKARDLMVAGMPEPQARAAASRAFGSQALTLEDSRGAWRFVAVESMLQDLRLGARALRRTPVFALTVVVVLALGIGANAAIFTLLDRVLLRTLPVQSPGELVVLGSGLARGVMESDGPPDRSTDLFSYPLYRDLRARTDVFSDLAAVSSFPVTAHIGPAVPARGQPLERADALLVSGNFFDVLGVRMFLGRGPTGAGGAVEGGEPVVVLSHGFWTRRFGQDRQVLGRTIHANGTAYAIVGVLGPELRGISVGRDTDLWIPMAMQPRLMRESSYLDARNTLWLRLIGRLRSGVTPGLAQERTNGLFHQLVEEEAGTALTTDTKAAIADLRTELVSFAAGFTHMRQRWDKPLLVLMTVVGLVLLIVCANVGNLLLARGSSRQRELAMRLALGAGRLRLIRQLLTESALLAALGGALALVVAQWTIRFLLGILSPQGAAALDTGLDGRVLLVTMGTAALTVALFGVVPAVRATRVEITPALRRQSGMASGDGHGGRLRKTLVIFQVAVSLCLLIGAGLLVSSLGNLRAQDMGFRPDGAVLIEIDPQGGGYSEARLPALHRSVLDRITALPDVSAAGLSLYGLLSRARRIEVASVDGYESKANGDSRVQVLFVTPRYFEAIGASLVAGRPFDEQDEQGGPDVAIVSESFARHFLGGQSAVGSRFGFDGPQSSRAIEIVGTVRDIKATDLWEKAPRLVYRPAAQVPTYLNSVVVRSRRDPAVMVPRLRQVVAEVAADLPVIDITPLTAQVDVALRDERMLSQLSSLFGVLALLLASIGLHGVLAYSVAQRTGEIGLRMALGAGRRQVLWMVLRDGLAWVGIGAAIGLLASLAFGRLLSSLLFGLDPIDPATILVAAATLFGVAGAAAYWPARRASRLDPFTALRCE